MKLPSKIITGCLVAGAVATLVAAGPAQANGPAQAKAPAQAGGRAIGQYTYSGGGNKAVITHPTLDRCYDVALVSPSSANTTTNGTDANANLYGSDDCSGDPTAFAPGRNAQGFEHRSVKFVLVG
ncbi:hypothetical protein [Streptomyces sp. SID13031]|uniref:hypothetical protein n=1 Tax=Streptomyces sp. SID13031 TaxID=2706046 RepID=UPI0013C82F6D|nr:hypothetical protein [Streptomyces sp. SID13031]NEA31947.1 hypothetical protein [Streptomyces sp. SID13031]